MVSRHLSICTGLVQVLLPPHQAVLPLQGRSSLSRGRCVVVRMPQGLQG